MTDDLVKRLRWSADGWDDCENPENAQQDREAADRIEELEKYKSLHAECEQASSELMQKLVGRLRDAHKRIEQLEGDVPVWFFLAFLCLA